MDGKIPALLFFFILIGAPNLDSHNIVVSIFILLMISFTSFIIFKNKLFLFLVLITILAFYTFLKGFSTYFALGIFSGLFLAYFLESIGLIKKTAIFVIISTFIVISWFSSIGLRTVLSSDLSTFSYNNDQGAFLKTYYYMNQNLSYYNSFAKAMTGKFSHPNLPSDIWSWRLPTIFVIWKLLPTSSGMFIYISYLTLASSVIFVSYLIGERYMLFPYSVLPPYLIFAYLIFGAKSHDFLLTELWGLFPFLIGMYLVISKRLFYAIIFISLAVLIREIYILPIALMLVYAALKKRRLIFALAIPLFFFCTLFFFHLKFAGSYIDSIGTVFNLRMVHNGFYFIQQTLSFGSGSYLFFPLRPFVLLSPLALLGCYYVYKRNKNDEAVLWLLSFLPFPLAFLKFGNTPFNDYWGIFYVPTFLILAPLALGLTFKKNDD